jgi:hypothetical protein
MQLNGNSREKADSLVAAATQVPYIILPGGESVSEALSFGTNLCRPSDSFSRFSSFSGQGVCSRKFLAFAHFRLYLPISVQS